MNFKKLNSQIISCNKCLRLVKWREQVAVKRVKRFKSFNYWGRPVIGFGDTRAKLLIVGLAPAAHGANRTGRMFTGDCSGDWLIKALYKFGFANKSISVDRSDGLVLKNCYITAACRCSPPENKPTITELENCMEYLKQEVMLLKNLRVVCGLGKIGFDKIVACLKELRLVPESQKIIFAHGCEYFIGNNILLIGTYHPSQQNTFTKKLTEPMFDNIFRRIKRHLEKR